MNVCVFCGVGIKYHTKVHYPTHTAYAQRMTDNLDLERTLWAAADKLRSNMDAAEYKHVVLGLIFLKYISDAFDAKFQWLTAHVAEGYDPEDRDEYLAEKVFWVPTEARWTSIQQKAKQPDIGSIIDCRLPANSTVQK